MDEPAGGETLKQDEAQVESSRSLSGREPARQDPAAPAVAGYTLASRLGAGAFGEVWRAWQQRTGKWVALKVFPRRHGVDWLLLQREVERLIRLDKHPNVVSLLDADLTGDPPYFAMELMEGGSLAGFVDPARKASPEQAARWAEELAEALCYAHSKGVLHCDLKPANVLLDDRGRVRVADFGQSRIVSESTGALGTLYFMAPEQAFTFSQNQQICPDVRWDLFGLGATLHAVLTGGPPHEAALRAKLEAAEGLEARLEVYRDELRREPVPDSGADEDLAAIIRRCLAPWPEGRYTAAREVLADLSARREGRPVSPLAGGALYRLRKFARRNAVPVGLGLLLAAALGGATATILRKNAALRTELANAYMLRGRAASERGDDAGAGLLYARANALAPSAAARRGALSHLKAIERPRQVWRLEGPAEAVAISPDGSRILVGGPDARFLDAKSGAVINRLGDRSGLRALPLLGASYGAAFSPDGARALLDEPSSRTRLLDGVSGAELAVLKGRRARFGPDGKLIATVDDKQVRFWDAATGKPVGGTVRHFAAKDSWEDPAFEFSRDGKVLLTCLKESIQFWEVPSGAFAGSIGYDSETRMAIGPTEEAYFSPKGGSVLSVTWARALLLDRRSGKPIGKVMRHDGRITDGAYTPDGARVLTTGEDGTLRKWLAVPIANQGYDAGAPADDSMRHGSPIVALAVSPDGTLAATGGMDGVARLWGVGRWDSSGNETGPEWGPYGRAMVHAGPVLSLAFSGDGKSLATASRDGTVRLWDVPQEPTSGTYLRFLASEARIFPDASRVFASDYSEGARLQELPSGRVIAGPLAAPVGPKRLAKLDLQGFDPAGKRFVGVIRDGVNEAWVFDGASGERLAGPFRYGEQPGGRQELQFARLSPDGKRLVGYATHEGLALWDVGSGRRLVTLRELGFVHDAAFSPDGSRIAVSAREVRKLDFSGANPFSIGSLTGGWHTEIRDAANLERVILEVKHGGGAVAWSRDGRRLATVDNEAHTLRLWDAASGKALGEPIAYQDRLITPVFSPDGRVLLSGSNDGTGWLTDAETGTPIGSRLPHGGPVWCLALAPDGSAAAVGGMNGLIRFWDTRTGEALGPALRQGRLVTELAFSPDGRTLYAVGSWSLRGWDVSWLTQQPSPESLLSSAEARTQRRVDERGGVSVIPVAAWDRRAAGP